MYFKSLFRCAFVLSATISFGAMADTYDINDLIKKANDEASKELRLTALQSHWFGPINQSLSLEEKIPNLSQEQEFLSSMVHVLWNAEDLNGAILRESLLQFYRFLPNLESLSTQDQVKVIFLGLKSDLGFSLKHHLTQKLYQVMSQQEQDDGVFYLILSEYSNYHHLSSKNLKKFLRKNPELLKNYISATTSQKKIPTIEEIKSLFEYNPDLTNYLGGIYNQSLKMFVLCRTHRNYPCRMVMKDSHGEWARNLDGSLWTNPVLAMSKHNYPFNKTSGHTPTGIYTMDSVIPSPTSPMSYGQFRRIILNFIPRSKNENLQTYLLPENMKELSWWKQAVIARDIGRNLLRIHGTGLTNNNPESTYYPFIPSLGCIKNREGIYNGVEYKDQRLMLDLMMESLGLNPIYENETLIRGLLYVIDLDDSTRPVELTDIEAIISAN